MNERLQDGQCRYWHRGRGEELETRPRAHLSRHNGALELCGQFSLADVATPAVARQLRHFDERTTLEVYGYVTGDLQRSVVQNRSATLVN